MAHIERIEGKRGLTYRFIVSGGFDITGKRITHKKTWKPPDGMTARQTEKAAQRAAFSCVLTGGRGETISTLARWSGQCKRKMRFCNYFSAIPHFDGEIRQNIDESNH